MEKTMRLHGPVMLASCALLAGLAMSQPADGHGKEEHATSPEADTMLEHMREMHKGHTHEHHFETMDAMTPEDMRAMMSAMAEIGLAMPPMDAHRGRELFVNKGCVVCHQANGVGGEIGPPLDAADMPSPMNAFEFAARMWRGAGAMIQMQQDLFGDQIELTGQDLADLVAFAHDEAEQRELSKDEVPARFRDLIDR